MSRAGDRTGRDRAPSGATRFTADPRQDAHSDLLTFLSDRMLLSRRAAKRLLDERMVFVNGQRIWMAHHRLHADDQVEVRRPHVAPEPDRAIRLLTETADALVVDKPAGLLTTGDDWSVDVRLRKERDEPDLVAVHRLDRETTGCLWLARSAEALDRAIRLFRNGQVHKVYEAIVLGRFPRSEALLDSPIEGRTALTRVERIAVNPRATRLRIRIETGRTHQIRKHLLEAGFPIAGDKQYGASRRLDSDLRDLPRQMLHAAKLEAATDGAPLRATAPLPADFRAALNLLGLP